MEHVRYVGFSSTGFYTCNNKGEPQGWLNWKYGKSCSKNVTTTDCNNCTDGKIITNITCIHDKSEVHYYCEHGTNYTTDYHT